MPVMLCVRFRSVNRSSWVLRRRVERIKLQGAITCIDNIMPRACGNENGVITVYTADLLQIASAVAHIDRRFSALHAYKLVNVLVHLCADVTAYGNVHQGQLHVPSRPKRRAKILVPIGCVIDIEYKRLAPVITDVGMLTAAVLSHKRYLLLWFWYQYMRKRGGRFCIALLLHYLDKTKHFIRTLVRIMRFIVRHPMLGLKIFTPEFIDLKAALVHVKMDVALFKIRCAGFPDLGFGVECFHRLPRAVADAPAMCFGGHEQNFKVIVLRLLIDL